MTTARQRSLRSSNPRTGSTLPAAIASAAFFAVTIAATALAGAQPTSDSPLAPPPNGPRSNPIVGHALVGIDVHTRPGVVIEDTTIYIQGDRIAAIDNGPLRPGYRAHDSAGLNAYAGFIDPWVEVETPSPAAGQPGTHWSGLVTPQRDALGGDGLPESAAKSHRGMGFTAAAIVPQGGVFQGQSALVSLAEPFTDPSSGTTPVYATKVYHAVSFQRGGWPSSSYPTSQMGAAALIRQTLADADWLGTLPADHPERQHNALNTLSRNNAAAPLVIDGRDDLESLLGASIAADYKRDAILLGSGSEYQRLAAFSERSLPIITPLNFTKAPNVSSPGDADNAELDAMMQWEQSPTNPWRLDNAGVKVALTAAKLGRGQKFTDNLRAAINAGLAPERALAMLTTTPAELLGVTDRMGTLEAGKLANIIVTDGRLFDTDTEIKDVWIDGRRHVINKPDHKGLFDGDWRFLVGPVDAPVYEMAFTVDGTKVNASDDSGSGKAHNVRMRHDADGDHLSFIVHSTDKDTEGTGIYIVSGTLDADGVIRGTAVDPAQDPFTWTGIRADATADETKAATEQTDALLGTWHATLSGRFHLGITIEKSKDEDGTANVTIFEDTDTGRVTQTATVRSLTNDQLDLSFDHTPFGMRGTFTLMATRTADALHGTGTRADGQTFNWFAAKPVHAAPALPGQPFGPFAMRDRPGQDSVAIINATVWTMGPQGTIANGYVFMNNGVITGAGPMPALGQLRIPDGARVVDAKGKHVAPGIIDAHSHTGLFRAGVNESGQAVTAEVRIGDSTNPDAVSWYRQLASGVTAALQLHGSANPIGGQSQTVKIRWGVDEASDMHFEGAIPGIKFALGENVKQSNWGDDRTTRYPQTRMGVETLIRDRFLAARAYLNNGRKTANGRTDLELEALAEILAGERLIHCHSYRQDEILMLTRIAEEFGFTIGTFTHGLEVYKVAETVQKHAIGASLFGDWWAYKVEVQDAIPFAGPLQAVVGVNTSYNSDSDELVRRLNTEAGKAYHYAKRMGLDFTQEDALAFVTINPARQLKIDAVTGSLETGKQADLAIWSANPLSTLARCETTFVDGRELFSLERDASHRQRIASERERLIAKILDLPEPKIDDKPEPDAGTTDDATNLVDPDRFAAGGFNAMSTVTAGRRGVLAPAHAAAASAGLDLEFMTDTQIEQLLTQPGVCGCHWLLIAP